MKMCRDSFLSQGNNSLRETLLSTDEKEVFRCSEYFEPASVDHFLDPEILQQLFTHEDMEPVQRVRMLERVGGLVYVMSRLKVRHEVGLTRFDGFAIREKLYGVNYQSPNSCKKYIHQFKCVLRDEVLLRWFIAIWFLTLVSDYLFDHLKNPSHIIASVIMFLGLLMAKIMVKNYVDSDINQSLSYSKSQCWVTVRREGKIVKIQQSDLLVGDILLFSTDDTISVDGLIIKADETVDVDQYKTISEKFNAKKTDGWAVNDSSDPFIFAGTEILFGKGEMIVCCVGEKCTFRTVSKSKSFIQKKTRHIREGQAKYIILSMRLAQAVIAIVIYFKMVFLLIELSPLDLSDIPPIMRDFIHHLSWALILQDMQRIQYMYCFIENRTCQQKEFKIINKLVLGEILKIDVLLVDESMLEIQEQNNARENQLLYLMHYEETLSELNTVVDIKILTQKSLSKCKEFKLNNPHFINKETVDSEELKNIQECKFICNIDPSYYFPYLVKAYTSLNYKVGVVPVEIEDKLLDNKIIVISTDDSSEEVQSVSWVKLNSSTCEEGLRSLYKISTNFYILMAALINQHFLSLSAVIYGVICIQLPVWVILLLVILQVLTIYIMYKLLSAYQSNCIQTGQSFQNNFLAHHLTIVPFFLYSIYSIDTPKDIAIFLVCRNIVSLVYNTRMGHTILPPFRQKFMDYAYILLLIIMLGNYSFSYFFENSTRASVAIMMTILSINLIYLAEKNYNATMRKKPHVSFN